MRLKGSVGQGGKNDVGDALYVQILLADWLAVQGKQPIAIDGKVGPRTIGAIKTFQSANTPVVDGVVDVGRMTIGALELAHITNASTARLSPRAAARASYRNYRRANLMPAEFWNRYLDVLRGQ